MTNTSLASLRLLDPSASFAFVSIAASKRPFVHPLTLFRTWTLPNSDVDRVSLATLNKLPNPNTNQDTIAEEKADD